MKLYKNYDSQTLLCLDTETDQITYVPRSSVKEKLAPVAADGIHQLPREERVAWARQQAKKGVRLKSDHVKLLWDASDAEVEVQGKNHVSL